MMALNIIFTSIFSALILREPISKQVTLGSLALIFFIVLAHLSGGTSASFARLPSILLCSLHGSLFLVLLALVGRRFLSLGNQVYGSLFALAAGCLEGIIIVIVKVCSK